jgi:hypothetical protein
MITMYSTADDLPNLPGLPEKLFVARGPVDRQDASPNIYLQSSQAIICGTAVLICKGDSSDIYPHVSARLENPSVIGAVKSYWQTAWNLPTIDMRHFVTHLPPAPDWPKPQPNPPTACAIRPWLEYIHQPQMEAFARIGAEYVRAGTVGLQQRTLTASFDGTTEYTAGQFVGPAVTRHRQALAPLASPRRLSPLKYVRRLRNSLCVVSPWGYGEACWRDWEAILCGAAVVKPASPWVMCESGYFQSDHVTWCKPDWSNLKDAIDMAASKTNAQRLAAIEWALSERARAADIVATSLAAIIKEAGL